MKQLAFQLFFTVSFIPFIFGQAFISESVDVNFYYPTSKNVIQSFKTYTAQVVDKEQTLRKVRIIPNDIARNHLILPDFIKVKDSADLQLYVAVGAFELIDARPTAKKENIISRQGVERRELVHSMQLLYKVPLYMRAYDCAGRLVWSAKAEQEKIHYFGNNILSKTKLEQAWNAAAQSVQRFLVEDELIGQASLWIEDFEAQLSIKKEKETLRILVPRSKEAYPTFQKGVRMTKTILRKLGQKKSHQEMVEWTLPVINYWKDRLPEFEKEAPKLKAAALYNLALLYYSIDQLEESTTYVNKSFAAKSFKYMTKSLIEQIQGARSYYEASGFTTRQVYSNCEFFQKIAPSQIRFDSIVTVSVVNEALISAPDHSISASNRPTGGLVGTLNSALSKKEEIIEDGLVFLNNGQLLQGRIDGDLTRPKVLRRGILFTPFEEEGTIKQKTKATYFKPSQLKRFVSDGKTFESHKAGTFFFSLINRRYFMEVLEQGYAKILYLSYRKRSPMGIWLIPWHKEKIVMKIPGKEQVVAIEKVNMYELLKNAPPVLEKYKAGIYGNKPNRTSIQSESFVAKLITLDPGIPSGGSRNIQIARAVIRDYNAYVYQQKDKAKTSGFKIN